ncbi:MULTISPECIES: hypothetical protein [unclassified Ruegeria]|nr:MULTISPECIES: hypothetical protein [unclassified Ruegeria]UUV08546.1 hypothetical protein NOR97_20385 [Ruegeria sp. YS9]
MKLWYSRLAAMSLAALSLAACAPRPKLCPLQPPQPEYALPQGCRVQWEGADGGAYFICEDGREGFVS